MKAIRKAAPAAGNIIDLTGYKIATYHVGIVREPQEELLFKRSAKVRAPMEVYRFAEKVFVALRLDQDREHFIIICLDNKNKLNGLKVISTGSLTSSPVHPREVFHAAITLHAARVVFVHNHPSGDPRPSQEDIDITNRLKEVGDVLGISVLDHVVIGRARFYSFMENKKL